MSKVNLAYPQAKDLAERIKATLSPGCERIEIAGSIRREKPVIGDIEIVCAPKRQRDMFGAYSEQAPSFIDPILARLIDEGHLLPAGKDGEKFKKFVLSTSLKPRTELAEVTGLPHAVSDLHLDLFITTPEKWGVIFTLRTGSAEFSKRLVMQRSEGGLLPDDCLVSEGRVWRNGQPLATPEERDVFDLVGGWVEPPRRRR